MSLVGPGLTAVKLDLQLLAVFEFSVGQGALWSVTILRPLFLHLHVLLGLVMCTLWFGLKARYALCLRPWLFTLATT